MQDHKLNKSCASLAWSIGGAHGEEEEKDQNSTVDRLRKKLGRRRCEMLSTDRSAETPTMTTIKWPHQIQLVYRGHRQRDTDQLCSSSSDQYHPDHQSTGEQVAGQDNRPRLRLSRERNDQPPPPPRQSHKTVLWFAQSNEAERSSTEEKKFRDIQPLPNLPNLCCCDLASLASSLPSSFGALKLPLFELNLFLQRVWQFGGVLTQSLVDLSLQY